LGGRYFGFKKMSPFENISVDFSGDGLVGKTGVRWEQKVWFWIDTDDGISSKAPEWMLLAPLGVSLARESPSCCGWLRRIQDSQR
jgi:hypothetical protein